MQDVQETSGNSILLVGDEREIKVSRTLTKPEISRQNSREFDTTSRIEMKEFFAQKSSNVKFSKWKIEVTIWNLPLEARAGQIKRNLSFYRKVIVKEFLVSKRLKAAFIELWPKNARREEFLESSWGIHYENGKMVQLTQEKFDKDTLWERNKFKAIVRNVPTTTVETALLRQLKGVNARVVYISSNRNWNQQGTVSIYFGNEEDFLKSQTEQVFYYNTKLVWSLMKDQVRMTRAEKFKVRSEPKLNSKERYRIEHMEESESSNSKGKKREDQMP